MTSAEIVSAATTIITISVSIWAIVVAHRANSRSSTANKIAQDALAHQKLIAPPPWGEVEELGERRFKVVNKSGRSVNVLTLDVRPADNEAAVTFSATPGELIEYGNALFFKTDGTASGGSREIEVAWVYADQEPDWDGEPEYLYRTIP